MNITFKMPYRALPFLVLLALMSSCAMKKININLEKVTSDTTLNVQVGDNIVVSVYENLSTGAMWYLDGFNGTVELLKEDYETVKRPPGWVGAGGTKKYFFKAQKTGSCSLIFTYKRGWQPESGVIKNVHFIVN